MTNTNKPKALYWIVAVLALIWNGMGVMAYLAQVYMTDADLKILPEGEQALYADVPSWVTAAFAIAVFAGVLGSLMLLIKKKWAIPVFILSLITAIVTQAHHLFMTDAPEVYGSMVYFMPAMVIIIAVFLVMYSRKAASKGWIS